MSKGQGLNSKALRWHFIEDIFGWIVVLIAALVMMVWPIPALDAAMGIILAVWVMWNVYKILLQALRVFLQATPVGLSTDAVIEQILKISSVKDVHHLHIWTMDGESHILTCHVTLNSDMKLDQIAELKREIKQGLLESFNISEATLEFEWSNETCQDPEHIVR